ncbi:MAG TPA: arginase family protein [Candidatus Bathyarchaeia archaeon]|nr:arginase family protein [Candidatus Bathyarchaeia archaeon]
MNSLTLFFPQWQGSGRTPELYEGAQYIKDILLKEHPITGVDVPTDEELDVEHHILGYTQILNQLKQSVALLNEKKPNKIFSIGGDCGIELSPISYLNKVYAGDLAVLWFDAHGDLNSPSSSPSKHFHGMPLRTLLGDGEPQLIAQCFSCLTVPQVILAGVRELDLPEEHFIKESGLQVITVDQLRESRREIIQQIQAKDYRHIYIHLDLDVLDPEEFAETKCPVTNGIRFSELLQLLNELHDTFQVVGYSLVEYAPKNPQNLRILKQLVDYGLKLSNDYTEK